MKKEIKVGNIKIDHKTSYKDMLKARKLIINQKRDYKVRGTPRLIMNIVGTIVVLAIYASYFMFGRGGGAGLVFAFSIMLSIMFLLHKIEEDPGTRKLYLGITIVLGIVVLFFMFM